MKKISNKLIRCVLKFALAVCCIGVSGMTFGVQAQENSRGIEQTADLKFLAVCDENDFKGPTVTDAQAAELQKKVDELTKGLKNDYEKAKSIFYWVNTNVRYPENDENVQPAVDAYDVYKQRVAVCGGFSNLYNELLHLAEIPSVAVAGYYLGYDYPAAHQWNAVYADGRWFYADTTGAGFDAPGLLETHQVVEVYDAVLETEDLLIGYYNGVAVIGTQQVMNEVTVPDTYRDMKITSISYQLFNKEYGVEVLNIGVHVNNIEKTTLVSAERIKEINVAKENSTYASRDGILYTKDMKELLAYPKAREVKKYILPKETIVLDVKDAFGNPHLGMIEVEDGNPAFSSYDGALYDAEQKELKFVPPGKTSVIIPENAGISDMAFASADRENIVIYGTPGSYAEKFAGWYFMKFVDIKEMKVEAEVYRIYGENRYETAFKTADKLKEVLGIAKFETVVIATGNDFADALAGSYLAAKKNAPILLVNEQQIKSVKEYIHENLRKDGIIYLLGGENAIPKAMETGMDGYVVNRLSGRDRYQTNLAILKEAGVENEDILVCTGKDFADSLSASAAAKPILLVGNTLEAEQKEYLNTLETDKFYVIGGEAAVGEKVFNKIKKYGNSCTRIGGKTRYETSVLVAKEFVKGSETAVLAYSMNFPDGLCAGPLAVKLSAPLILTMTEKETEAAAYLSENKIHSGFILGGDSLISDDAAKIIFTMDEDKIILEK